MPDTITITDDRTGKTVTVPIEGGVFPSSALRDLDPSLYCYDPAFLSTASCKSAITYLDGDAGILRYGGYPIEQLAEHSSYLEVAYLLLNGELPTKEQLELWVHDVTHHTFIHENMRKRFVDGFHYNAHPMGMFTSAVAALGTFYEGAKDIDDPSQRDRQILRLIAKAPTIAAMCYRFSVGLPFNAPSNDLSYPANFLNMMWKIGDYEVDPVLERAMEVLFILHADHEQNCGTTAIARDRVEPRRSLFVGSRRRGSVVRPAPWRRQRGGRADAHRDRLGRQRSCVRRRGQGRRRSPDGLRSPRATRTTTRGPASSSRPRTTCSR